MSLRLYALTCGWLTLPEAALIEGGRTSNLRIPVPAYLIVHPRGTALFDTGLAPICSSPSADRDAYLGALGAQVRVERAGPDGIAANAYKPVDYDQGHDRLLIDGEHDVFGDGSVTCIPTYGHTPGHQSLRVKTETGEIVLCGDACYLRETLETLRLPPGAAWDRGAMEEALRRLRAYQARGARIFYGHDPGFWSTLPKAPQTVA
ncbi:MBL fold metallo-hydrolase [Myxococcota bacterium]|nr:MBL fold metallo-hydrolase [Myxococcota bacterium]